MDTNTESDAVDGGEEEPLPREWVVRSGGAIGSDAEWMDLVCTLLREHPVTSSQGLEATVMSFPQHRPCLWGHGARSRVVRTYTPQQIQAQEEVLTAVKGGRWTHASCQYSFKMGLLFRDAALALAPCDVLLVCSTLRPHGRLGIPRDWDMVSRCEGGTGVTWRMLAHVQRTRDPERALPVCFVDITNHDRPNTPIHVRLGTMRRGVMHQNDDVHTVWTPAPTDTRFDLLGFLRDCATDADLITCNVTMIGARKLPRADFLHSLFCC